MKLRTLLKHCRDEIVNISYNSIGAYGYWEVIHGSHGKYKINYYANGGKMDSVPPLPLDATVDHFYAGTGYDEYMEPMGITYIQIKREENNE